MNPTPQLVNSPVQNVPVQIRTNSGTNFSTKTGTNFSTKNGTNFSTTLTLGLGLGLGTNPNFGLIFVDNRPRAVNWVVVLYNNYLPDKMTIDPDAPSLAAKEAWFNQPQHFKYAVFGREKCPTSGRPHLQGFVACHKQLYLSQMKKLFPDGQAHFEIAGGNPEHNRRYCIKVNFFNERWN